MKLCIVTIVSGNYLAYAKVLAASVSAMVPEAAFRVLVVDRPSDALRKIVIDSGLQAIFATELGIPDIERIAYKYDIVELNTALKPTFLKLILDEGYSHVIYLDPDIQVFTSLTPVFDAMDKASITLIPHALQPILDGMRPSEVDFLVGGVFNLGFIALRDCNKAREMLEWWEARCLGLGFNDPGFGIFVDQKWIDLVPCYFESVHILRHPGCNVAYWNLHEREVKQTGDLFTINNQLLVFFHFSGVNANNPNQLSKHTTRHSIVPGTPMDSLVTAYCESLINAGHSSISKLPYSFGSLDDGTPITSVMRRSILCASTEETRPFDPKSSLQCRLRQLGITPHGALPPSSKLDQAQPRVKAVNFLIRLFARILGADRLLLLLRYTALVSHGAHYPEVLMNLPLDRKHLLRR